MRRDQENICLEIAPKGNPTMIYRLDVDKFKDSIIDAIDFGLEVIDDINLSRMRIIGLSNSSIDKAAIEFAVEELGMTYANAKAIVLADRKTEVTSGK